ncbi:MAG: hypothetical protein ACOY4L_00135 [Pseudomonadota bacterium]
MTAGPQPKLRLLDAIVLIVGIVLGAGIFKTPSSMDVAGLLLIIAAGLVMVFVLLTYGGWNEAAYVSAGLRAREPAAPRSFRVPLYPLTPRIFCARSAYLLYDSLAYTGIGALCGGRY